MQPMASETTEALCARPSPAVAAAQVSERLARKVTLLLQRLPLRSFRPVWPEISGRQIGAAPDGESSAHGTPREADSVDGGVSHESDQGWSAFKGMLEREAIEAAATHRVHLTSQLRHCHAELSRFLGEGGSSGGSGGSGGGGSGGGGGNRSDRGSGDDGSSGA